MKIFVTGGCGFIGHNVVNKLQNHHKITIIDNETDYGIIPQSEIQQLLVERKQNFINKNIANYTIASAIVHDLISFHKPDVIIHLASFPRQKVVNENPMMGSKSMSEGLLNLLDASAKNNVRRFIYASSSMVYGNWTGAVQEDKVCNPIGQYAIMKYAGEMLVKDYARKGLDYTIVRPSAVYGPKDVNDRVVSKFLHSAKDGKTLTVNGELEMLDFTNVEDTTDGIIGIVENLDKTRNETYNIARGNARTIIEAAELCVKLSGKGNINVVDRDNNFPSRGPLDCSKATQHFGYSPSIDIEQGFSNYWKWITR